MTTYSGKGKGTSASSSKDPAFLERLRATARQAAASAGEILREGLTRKIEVGFKGRINLVTEVDLASERTIIEILSKAFPEHGFLAEESGARNGTASLSSTPRSSGRWIIDPLDGTTNYAHRYPAFCISIAYEEAGTVLYGLVSDPLRRMDFEALRGQGGTLNGSPLSVSSESDPERSLLCTGFSYRQADGPFLRNLDHFERFSRGAQGIRRSGSAALDLCHVAMGVLDGFWELDLSPWDTAAGTLIVAEAGGQVTDGTGAPFHIEAPIVVASNGRIHEWMVRTIRQDAGDQEQKPESE
ncbi:MAG: inositol monophosphatase family protein [Leptospirillia bacterium]